MRSINSIIKKLENYKKDGSQNKLQIIGSLIKQKRKELDLTQQEVSNGICSNSYLSKIESNKINPNVQNLYLLMERMNIDINDISCYANSDELLYRAISFYYYDDLEEYHSLFENIKEDNDNPFSLTIAFGYYLLKNDMMESERIYQLNSLNPDGMDEVNVHVYSIFCIIYFLKIGKLIEANKIINSLKEISTLDSRLDLIIKLLEFDVYTRTMRLSLVVSIYPTLINLLSSGYDIKWQEKITMSYLKLLIDEKEYNEAKRIINGLHEKTIKKYSDEINYYFGIIKLSEEEYSEAIQYFEKVSEQSNLYIKCCIRLYDLDNKKNLDDLKELYDKTKSTVLLTFIYEKEDRLSKEYLYNVVLKEALESGFIVNAILVYNYLVSFLSIRSRYKEALQIMRERDNYISMFKE